MKFSQITTVKLDAGEAGCARDNELLLLGVAIVLSFRLIYPIHIKVGKVGIKVGCRGRLEKR
jgi:hypothetical protein